MEFLSDEWFAAANQALAAVVVESELVVEQRIRDRPDLTYQLRLAEGVASLVRAAGDAEVTLEQSLATATEIRRGALSGLEAVQNGQVTVAGDPLALIAAAEALKAVDSALSAAEL